MCLLLKSKSERSLEICGAVNLQELLFGSQEDVGFEPEGREAEVNVSVMTSTTVWSRPPHILNILADLPLEPMAPLLQLLDGAVLRKFVGSTSHLALRQRA